MRVTEFKFHFRKSDYGNTFLFLLPFINLCFYKGYTTVSFGWLVFWLSFYITVKEKQIK